MLRTVKYGLSGAVVAGVIGGSIAWTNVSNLSVHLLVDGRGSAVQTKTETVGELLREAGYRVGPHDIVAPGRSTQLHQGETVVLRRGRLLRISVDGRRRAVWTTAPTVSAALDDLGLSGGAAVSVSRSQRLPLSPTDISVRTPKTVTLAHDGQSTQVTTTAATVGTLLREVSVRLHPADIVSEPTDAPLTQGERISITRIVDTRKSVVRRIPFHRRTTPDSGLEMDVRRVVRAGRPGRKRTTYALRYVNGRLTRRVKVRSVVLRRPVTELIHRGTALGPDATPAQTHALARSLLPGYGFGGDQMGCLITMWNHESSWRVTAENPDGGAYGIPQALPGWKMASAGPDWRTNAETQIRWGLEYIKSRYGTPCGAWATWQAHGGWY